MTSWTKELDEAAILACRSGHWHTVLFYLLCALAAIPTSFLVFSSVFTNATPEHWCSPPPELEVLRLPDELLRNLTVPKQLDVFDSCTAYEIDPRTLYNALSDYVDERSELVREGGALRMVQISQLVPATGKDERQEQIEKVKEAILSIRSQTPTACVHGWTYNTEHYTNTLVTEFSLFCKQEWLPRLGNTLFWVGSIFGNVFFGWMSDRYGRRPTTLLMIFLEVPLAIAASFPTTYWTYIGLRVAGGLFFPALYQQPFILALELMPPDKRTYAGIVVGMLFATGMCLLALLAYFIRDWFFLSLATSLPFIFLYGYYWIIPESPRWLVGRGRIAEAEKVLRDIAKRNGIELKKGFLLVLHKKIKEEEGEANVMLNGHIGSHSDTPEKDSYFDRRISNMLTFKPDLNNISEDETKEKEGVERILAKEVAEIVNKKHRRGNLSTEEDESQETEQKATQTDALKALSLRRKSVQLVTKIFIRDDEDAIENKKIDDQNSEGDGKASPLDIWRYPNIRKKFLLLTFDWVALGVVYNSLSYNSTNLGVDDYLAFFIGGAVELPSYFIAWRCMERFGRRWVLCIFMCVGGLACLSCVFVPESWPWITVSLAMMGRLFAASAFAVFYVLIGELLPTVLRAQAMGAASFISGLGLLACPYIVHLAVYARALPLIILGFLSVMGGITSLFLPETLNQPLPQTLGDGEMFGREFKILSCVEKPNQQRLDS